MVLEAMQDKKDWATLSMKENPFWRDGMTPEEYEKELYHYLKAMSEQKMGEYVPLWKQKEGGE